MKKKAGPAGKTSMPPWSVPVKADQIPDEGLHRDIEAAPEVLAGVAALADVRAVSQLSASLDLAREGALVRVTGRVRGRVGQDCVVTLEPIETDIDEAVDVAFAPVAPEGQPQTPRRTDAAEEPPEPLTGGVVDIGAIATEFLILGIDPYPRKAGVEFEPPPAEDDDPHPFAALAALKDQSGGGKP
ncbi:MAG TPA: DUF177 domain-containing protein [Pseudolabrys sp.]|nr:DUF177 domain-containing protein [Pseudolabrys sp.]